MPKTSLVRGVLVVFAVAIAYGAYRGFTKQKVVEQQQRTYSVGRETDLATQQVLQIVDGLNAGITRQEAERFAKEATAEGKLDIEKLGALLRPAAARAGQIKQLQLELERLAAGLPAKPASQEDNTAPSKPAGKQAARSEAARSSVPVRGIRGEVWGLLRPPF